MTDETHNTKPRRRWFQFSLRTLLIVVTLSAVPLGWVGWKLEQGRRQRAAIAWVEKMGGTVAFVSVEETSWWREWTDKLFGPSVREVDLRGTPVTDLSPLAGLKNLDLLYLRNTQVSDLSPLAELKNLKWLLLGNMSVSDEDVQELRQALPNCEIIHSIRIEE